jgi:hypothetical protein
MLLKRAKEEVELTKKEMITYIRFLVDRRSKLQQRKTFEDFAEQFEKGKAVMAVSEIQRLDVQIQLALKTFNLNCSGDFLDFPNESTQNISDTEFQFSSSDDENDGSSITKSVSSSEETESFSNSFSSDSEAN